MGVFLSIVIPVYKTAHLLQRCLDSLTGQLGYDPMSVEIIVVSDHSPDDADSIMESYRLVHPEVKYFVRDRNGGVAAARNTGLRMSSGAYYTYVDSDDCVTPDYLTVILGIIRTIGPDLMTYRYEMCDEGGRKISSIKPSEEGVYETTDDPSVRRFVFNVFAMNLRVNAVFRRQLVVDLFYREKYSLGEDALFAFEAYLRCSRFFVSNAILYRYYQYPQSATHNFDEKRLTDLMSIHGIYLEECRKLLYYGTIKRDLFYFFASNYLTWLAEEAEHFPYESLVGGAFRSRFESIVAEARTSGAISALHAVILLWLNKAGLYQLLRLCMIVEKILKLLECKKDLI